MKTKVLTLIVMIPRVVCIAYPSASDNKKYSGYKVMQQGLYTDCKLKAYDKAMLKSKGVVENYYIKRFI